MAWILFLLMMSPIISYSSNIAVAHYYVTFTVDTSRSPSSEIQGTEHTGYGREYPHMHVYSEWMF